MCEEEGRAREGLGRAHPRLRDNLEELLLFSLRNHFHLVLQFSDVLKSGDSDRSYLHIQVPSRQREIPKAQAQSVRCTVHGCAFNECAKVVWINCPFD